jgi:hypothetical protein
VSRLAAASTIPVTNAAMQENSKMSFRTLAMTASPYGSPPSAGHRPSLHHGQKVAEPGQKCMPSAVCDLPNLLGGDMEVLLPAVRLAPPFVLRCPLRGGAGGRAIPGAQGDTSPRARPRALRESGSNQRGLFDFDPPRRNRGEDAPIMFRNACCTLRSKHSAAGAWIDFVGRR